MVFGGVTLLGLILSFKTQFQNYLGPTPIIIPYLACMCDVYFLRYLICFNLYLYFILTLSCNPSLPQQYWSLLQLHQITTLDDFKHLEKQMLDDLQIHDDTHRIELLTAAKVLRDPKSGKWLKG